MWSKVAAIAVLPSVVVLAAPVHADPDSVDAGANVDANANVQVFLQDIAYDGIKVDGRQAVAEGYAVCKLMAPPDGGSLWDAGQQVVSKHPDWGIAKALKFSDRAVQDICPNKGGSF